MILAYAVCSVSVMPMRQAPDHRAEQISQVLFGERMEILELHQKGWYKIHCEWDEYEGWVKEGQVTLISYKEYRKPLHAYSATTTDSIVVDHGQFTLSPGSSLFLMKKKVMQWNNKKFTFKGRKLPLKQVSTAPENVASLSTLFIGSPYHWGGRSLMGMDCSGFTQMVFKLMNIRIPRDAHQQAQLGSTVSFLQEALCGDLAFFDNEEGHITHVGLLLNDHTIIHATDTSGCVVVDAIDSGGIVSRQLRSRTHNLRLVKRILATPDPGA
jgi:cell wall-associated NlpC family hydrolase